jgi:hypothetical protein
MGILEYLEANPAYFGLAFLGVLVVNLVTFSIAGRRADARFRDQGHQRIIFRERFASGRSNRSLLTKLGGASRALDVVVTDAELWIKGIWSPFTYIGTRYDLTHRVPLSDVRKVHLTNNGAELWFRNEEGSESHVELRLKHVEAFGAAMKKAESRHGA